MDLRAINPKKENQTDAIGRFAIAFAARRVSCWKMRIVDRPCRALCSVALAHENASVPSTGQIGVGKIGRSFASWGSHAGQAVRYMTNGSSGLHAKSGQLIYFADRNVRRGQNENVRLAALFYL